MDDDESDYLKTERYKNRYMKIYRKIAQLRQEGSNLGRNMDRKVNILLSVSRQMPAETDEFTKGSLRWQTDCKETSTLGVNRMTSCCCFLVNQLFKNGGVYLLYVSLMPAL